MKTVEEKLLTGIVAKKINNQINDLVVDEKSLAELGLSPKEAKIALLKTISEAIELLLKEIKE